MPERPIVSDPLPEEPPEEQLPEDGAEVAQAQAGLPFGKVALSVLFSLVVLLVVGYFTFEPQEFRKLLRQPDPLLLTVAGLTIVLRVVFGGLRLSYVSRGQLGVKAGLRGQLAWDFFSSLTPSALGGGPIAALYIARDNKITFGEATAFLLFCMLLDQLWFACSIPLVLGAALFLPVFPPAMGSVGTGFFVAFALGMLGWTVLFAYATLYRPELIQKAADLLFRIKWLRRFREGVAHEMRQLNRRAKILRSQPPLFFAKGVLLTGGAWLSRYILPLLVVWGVYPELDKFLFFLRTAAMTLLSIVLPTPGGSGGIEGLYLLFLGPLMPKTLVAPTLLTWRLLSYYLFLALGVFLSMHQVQKSLRRKRKAARAAAALDAAYPNNGTATPPAESARSRDR